MTTDAEDDRGQAKAADPKAPDEETGAAPDRVEAPPAAGGGATDRAHRGLFTGIIVLALALAFFAAGASGFLWWQYRQFYVALDRADGETETALRDVRAGLRGLEDRLGELGEDRAALVGVVEDLGDRVDEFPAHFAALEERIAAAQGISSDARTRWLRAQAEYYLSVANAEIALRHNRANAVAALELADRALIDAGSPAFAAVRERIAGELLGLEAVSVPDIEGLSFSLAQLAARVATLPISSPLGDERGDAARADAPPGIARLWQSVKRAVAGMFRIERSDVSSVPSLSRNQQTIVRRQVELELSLARAGLVGAMPELFATSIANARALIEAHFDAESAGVDGVLALLDEMAALDVAPQYPDISGSLTLLRNIANRDG